MKPLWTTPASGMLLPATDVCPVGVPASTGPAEAGTPTVETMESPLLSVAAGPDAPAFEMKFLVTESQAAEIEKRAKGLLLLDPHADPTLGSAYRVTSIYCDTPAFDVFHRTDGFKRTKHRLRRYGQSPHLFLERKARWQDRVKKRRTMVPDAERLLLSGASPVLDWIGHWFHHHLMSHSLAPVCLIGYERVALVGKSKLGPLRLTFDRNVRGVLTTAWDLDRLDEGISVLSDAVICEFKFRTALPMLFKDIIRDMRLKPCPVSKYRAFIRACKFTPNAEPSACRFALATERETTSRRLRVAAKGTAQRRASND